MGKKYWLGKEIYAKKTKTKSWRVYFDNGNLMTDNSFDDLQEAKEWLEDLRSIS